MDDDSYILSGQWRYQPYQTLETRYRWDIAHPKRKLKVDILEIIGITSSFVDHGHTFPLFSIYLGFSYTLWLFNIAMENDPFIDGLPINSMVIFYGPLLNNQMVITVHPQVPKSSKALLLRWQPEQFFVGESLHGKPKWCLGRLLEARVGNWENW